MTHVDPEHTTVIVFHAPPWAPTYDVQFEPEGGIRTINNGDRLTVRITGPGPCEIDIYTYADGIVIDRPLRHEITIIDQDGAIVDDLW
jgi:hypothetical protein